MPQAKQAALDAGVELDEALPVRMRRVFVAAQSDVHLAIHEALDEIEREWRAFEQVADCTVFQSFDWVSTWQRNIGCRNRVAPAIVIGRGGNGQLLFLFPLAVEGGGLGRRLTWLGSDRCDYNGPLLAPDFGKRIDAARFKQVWREILQRVQGHPRLWFDAVALDKMQMKVGAQANPFIGLGVTAHADGAYLTHLGGDWEKFYTDKRSSATRRRDRTKRKKLSEFGEVKFVTPAEASDVAATLATLIEQKSSAFAAMGVANLFARQGHREFYDALAAMQGGLAHVSRLDVGSRIAAANLGLIFRGSYYHLLASYDGGELSKFGPGAAHMHDLLRYAIERGCGAFDFTIGDERYKQEWCDTKIALYDHVAPVTPRGWPVVLKSYAVCRVKRFIKQTPALWDAAYKLRALIGPAMMRLRGYTA
jgi:CelD/BcsL family acetyltransferase involved in cellulose biosynthesis